MNTQDDDSRDRNGHAAGQGSDARHRPTTRRITLTQYTREISIRDVANENGQLRSIDGHDHLPERTDEAAPTRWSPSSRRTHRRTVTVHTMSNAKTVSRSSSCSISITITVLVTGAALTTFQNGADDQRFGRAAERRQPEPAGRDESVDPGPHAGRPDHRPEGHSAADRRGRAGVLRPGPPPSD